MRATIPVAFLAVSILCGAGAMGEDRKPDPKPAEEPSVAKLQQQVEDLRLEVYELRAAVRHLRAQVESLAPVAARDEPVAEGAPDPKTIAAAIRRKEIIVGMTWDEARRARPDWRREQKESGSDYEVYIYGRPWKDISGTTGVERSMTVTFQNDRITRVVHHRPVNMGSVEKSPLR